MLVILPHFHPLKFPHSSLPVFLPGTMPRYQNSSWWSSLWVHGVQNHVKTKLAKWQQKPTHYSSDLRKQSAGVMTPLISLSSCTYTSLIVVNSRSSLRICQDGCLMLTKQTGCSHHSFCFQLCHLSSAVCHSVSNRKTFTMCCKQSWWLPAQEMTVLHWCRFKVLWYNMSDSYRRLPNTFVF